MWGETSLNCLVVLLCSFYDKSGLGQTIDSGVHMPEITRSVD